MKSKRKIKELEREIDRLKDYIKVSREYDSARWAERNTIEVNKKSKIELLLTILSDLSYKINEIIKEILEVK